jgi:hypothetical protein
MGFALGASVKQLHVQAVVERDLLGAGHHKQEGYRDINAKVRRQLQLASAAPPPHRPPCAPSPDAGDLVPLQVHFLGLVRLSLILSKIICVSATR